MIKFVMQIKANLVDIKSRKIVPSLIDIENGLIVSIVEIDEVCSNFILPGFIDAHIHIESSMLVPSEFARLAVLHGSVATVSDPHEIANVLGVDGVEFMLENASKTDFKFFFGASPCVPATPFETSGAKLDVSDIKKLLKNPKIKFLSEVMNFPDVIARADDIMGKIQSAKDTQKPIDGHAPALSGDELNRYINAGISTDHEAFTYEEGLEKLQKGMKILIREGSAAKNFEALHPLIDRYHKNMMFCSDDRHPNDLRKEHINALVVRAIKLGHNLFDVLEIACLNPIEHYNLDVGILRVGDSADFIMVEDLTEFKIVQTVIDGKIVAKDDKTTLKSVEVENINNFNVLKKSPKEFYFSECENMEVIQVIDHELITHEKIIKDNDNDILKIAVVNRYENKPIKAIAHAKGFGLRQGAIASSVAHDSHNIIVVGCSDEEMAEALNLIISSKGGVSAVGGGKSHLLPLSVAGLMSDKDGFEVAKRYEDIDSFAKNVLGSSLSSPFMTLSFMALLVIPELKLSDKGLFDSRKFHFISPCAKGL